VRAARHRRHQGNHSGLEEALFNNLIWPDFSVIPTPQKPTIRYLELKPEKTAIVAGHRVRAILVDHTIEGCAFIVEGPDGAVAYSGDTGPTERLWMVLNEVPDLRALLLEVSYPNREQSSRRCRATTRLGRWPPR